MTPIRLRARWLLPVATPAVGPGAVLIGADGRIVAAGRDADVPAPAGAEAHDLGDVILLPGLVNTHAHLELTALEGLVKDLPFREWIQRVRLLKDALDDGARLASASWGVLDSFAAGITTIGDTGSTGAPAAALAALGARGVAYQEVFGPDPAQAAASLAGLATAVDALAAHASGRVRIGVSPHAPYTVSFELLGAAVAFARARGLPVAMHLAESPEEAALVREGAGPFAEALRARGIAVTAQGCSPVAWAARAGLLAPRTLLIHAVETDAADAAAIAAGGAAVAHCPSSNRDLGHGRLDLAMMRRAGVVVGLGTDSVATGAPLDLFREARLARDAAGLTPAEAVAMLTAGGAAALGLGDVGAIRPGAWADLAALACSGAGDPDALVLASSPADVYAAWVGGRLVFRDGAWPGADVAAVRAGRARAGALARSAVFSSQSNQADS